jgi:multisubunit Na+/H+ antiporter MnhG subunit
VQKIGTLYFFPVIRDPYERLHYMAPASTLGAMAVAAAIALDALFFQAGSKAVLVALLLGIANPVLSHATVSAIGHRQVAILAYCDKCPVTISTG